MKTKWLELSVVELKEKITKLKRKLEILEGFLTSRSNEDESCEEKEFIGEITGVRSESDDFIQDDYETDSFIVNDSDVSYEEESSNIENGSDILDEEENSENERDINILPEEKKNEKESNIGLPFKRKRCRRVHDYDVYIKEENCESEQYSDIEGRCCMVIDSE